MALNSSAIRSHWYVGNSLKYAGLGFPDKTLGIPWDTTGATYYTLVIVRDNANVSAYMNYSNDGDLELLGVSTATDNDPIVAPNGYQIGYCLPRNGGAYLDALVHSFTFWDNAALTLE